MRANVTKDILTEVAWDAYQAAEHTVFAPRLEKIGIILDSIQPHTSGERYLMSGKKLVLIGTRAADGARAVVKVSSDQNGRTDIRYEKEAHDLLKTLAFAHETLLVPKEIHYEDTHEGTVLVTAFIEQPNVFFARPLSEQFFLALRALEAQEGFHATTYEHEKDVKRVFPIVRSLDYLETLVHSIEKITSIVPSDTHLREYLKSVKVLFYEHAETIDRYTPYLTHTDMAPHNMRVTNQGIFLLDPAAFHFGNKYESWARFINYMMVHNPELSELLARYVRNNRNEDEYLALRLMRLYKIVFLLEFYAESLSRTNGELHELTKIRIAFWTDALEAVLADKPLAQETVTAYKNIRNRLRSPEETARQKEFNQI